MEMLNIKVIHPTNNSSIDIGCPENIILRDVFSQLIETNFLADGQPYTGILRIRDGHTESKSLDNDKTISENGIRNNDVIQTLLATQAGGGDFLWNMWQAVYPYLDQLGTVLGITGSAIGLGVWIKKKFSQSYSPGKFVSLIANKELWNAHELALTLDVSYDEAKSLLKGFGYKWDKKLLLYVKTDKTVEIKETVKCHSDKSLY